MRAAAEKRGAGFKLVLQQPRPTEVAPLGEADAARVLKVLAAEVRAPRRRRRLAHRSPMRRRGTARRGWWLASTR
jgi:hypothetical protein